MNPDVELPGIQRGSLGNPGVNDAHASAPRWAAWCARAGDRRAAAGATAQARRVIGEQEGSPGGVGRVIRLLQITARCRPAVAPNLSRVDDTPEVVQVLAS